MSIAKKKTKPSAESFWHFALVNGRLAEVFLHKHRIMGHCYVQAKEYKTQKEQQWIIKDTQSFRFTYRNKKYYVKGTRRLVSGNPVRNFQES